MSEDSEEIKKNTIPDFYHVIIMPDNTVLYDLKNGDLIDEDGNIIPVPEAEIVRGQMAVVEGGLFHYE
jgi:hypothetical protein